MSVSVSVRLNLKCCLHFLVVMSKVFIVTAHPTIRSQSRMDLMLLLLLRFFFRSFCCQEQLTEVCVRAENASIEYFQRSDIELWETFLLAHFPFIPMEMTSGCQAFEDSHTCQWMYSNTRNNSESKKLSCNHCVRRGIE